MNFHRSCVEIMHWIRHNGIVSTDCSRTLCNIVKSWFSIIQHAKWFLDYHVDRHQLTDDWFLRGFKVNSIIWLVKIRVEPDYTTVYTTLHGNTCIESAHWCMLNWWCTVVPLEVWSCIYSLSDNHLAFTIYFIALETTQWYDSKQLVWLKSRGGQPRTVVFTAVDQRFINYRNY